MAHPVEIRCYDYVNRPFDEVRDQLLDNPIELFHSATHVASRRANSLGAALHINVAGVEFGKEIDIVILGEAIVETARDGRVELRLEWKATKTPGLFPVMQGTLAAYPITSTETQLDFSGSYSPPMGLMGKAIDALVGRKIAEASVHSFVAEVAGFMRKNG
jgi:hypothetical protein